MFKRIPVFQIRFVILLLVVLLTGCVRARPDMVPSPSTVQDIEPVITEEMDSFVSPTAQIETPTPIPVEISPTPTSLPNVTVTAIKGNLFIRRGHQRESDCARRTLRLDTDHRSGF
jgi:PBP1b-binding outer membrane lipoprotein LpoB